MSKLEIVRSGFGGHLGVYLNDLRVAGEKPWGGGHTIYSFTICVEDERVRDAFLALWPDVAAEREAEAYRRGRAHERLDIVDFITSPPGRVPEWVQGQIAELAAAINRGAHDGWGKRLYTKDGAP
jgi:hypothetical protein